MQIHTPVRRSFSTSLLFLIMTFVGCAPDTPSPPAPSKDVQELKKFIDSPIPIQSATWEKFEFPDPIPGFFGTNYEATMLIAEVSPVDRRWFQNNDVIEMEYPAQNAIRHWLSEPSKRLLRNTPISKPENPCRYYETTAKSGEKIPGYACISGEKVLLYFLLDFAS